MSITRTCGHCGEEFEARRGNARYCQPAHRNAAYRQRRTHGAEPAIEAGQAGTAQSPSAGSVGSIAAATLAELQAVHLERTALGLAAIAAARRVDAGATEGGAAFAALVREHAAALVRALAQGMGKAGDRGDELAQRREKRRREAFGGSG